VLIPYRRFGTTYCSHFKDQEFQEESLSFWTYYNVGTELPLYVTANPRRAQVSLAHIAAEACSHAQ